MIPEALKNAESGEHPIQVAAGILGFDSDEDFLQHCAKKGRISEEMCAQHIDAYRQGQEVPFFIMDDLHRAAKIASQKAPDAPRKKTVSSIAGEKKIDRPRYVNRRH
ncbi:MAG: hypothetical protein AAB901_02705 [Patescibacteria group bacterium]